MKNGSWSRNLSWIRKFTSYVRANRTASGHTHWIFPHYAAVGPPHDLHTGVYVCHTDDKLCPHTDEPDTDVLPYHTDSFTRLFTCLVVFHTGVYVCHTDVVTRLCCCLTRMYFIRVCMCVTRMINCVLIRTNLTRMFCRTTRMHSHGCLPV